MDLEAKKRMRRFFFSKKKNCGLRKTRAGGPSNSESNWCGLMGVKSCDVSQDFDEICWILPVADALQPICE